ncbi:MAG TPA: hypothetical protein VGA88_09140 [Burkholderiales bacterium]|jgi:hypothetical protein
MFEKTAALLFRYLLAISIVFAPMVPAFAASKIDAGRHAAHAPMHDAGEISGDPVQPNSGKHLNCYGHCCLACGMSIVDVPIVPSGAGRARSVQTPTVQRLHPHPLVTVPHRPPRTLS